MYDSNGKRPRRRNAVRRARRIGKVWAGPNFGDNGWLYFDRDTINRAGGTIAGIYTLGVV